eukprot:12398379-Karenia_brevis.AAC.1
MQEHQPYLQSTIHIHRAPSTTHRVYPQSTIHSHSRPLRGSVKGLLSPPPVIPPQPQFSHSQQWDQPVGPASGTNQWDQPVGPTSGHISGQFSGQVSGPFLTELPSTFSPLNCHPPVEQHD